MLRATRMENGSANASSARPDLNIHIVQRTAEPKVQTNVCFIVQARKKTHDAAASCTSDRFDTARRYSKAPAVTRDAAATSGLAVSVHQEVKLVPSQSVIARQRMQTCRVAV